MLEFRGNIPRVKNSPRAVAPRMPYFLGRVFFHGAKQITANHTRLFHLFFVRPPSGLCLEVVMTSLYLKIVHNRTLQAHT